MVLRDFVKNFDDMSDQNGFQFKFKCDICQDGFMTKYRQAPYAKAKGLFGGRQQHRQQLRRELLGVWATARGELHPRRATCTIPNGAKLTKRLWTMLQRKRGADFTKCPGCTKYVDATCWNEQGLMCVECSPRQAITVQKARAQAFGQKAAESMMAQDYSAEIKGAEEVKILCSKCGKPTSSGKFCEVCGAPLDKSACPNCGQKVSATARFCNNCGQKLSG